MRLNIDESEIAELLNSKIPSDTLAHYGVNGMKWGVRNSRGGYERTGAGKKGLFRSREEIKAAKAKRAAASIKAQKEKNAAKLAKANIKLETANAKAKAKLLEEQGKSTVSAALKKASDAKDAAVMDKAKRKYDSERAKTVAKQLEKAAADEKKARKANEKNAKLSEKTDKEFKKEAAKEAKADSKNKKPTSDLASVMSNEELQSRISRIRMEQQYRELTKSPESAGSKARSVGKKLAVDAANKIANKAIERATSEFVKAKLDPYFEKPDTYAQALSKAKSIAVNQNLYKDKTGKDFVYNK